MVATKGVREKKTKNKLICARYEKFREKISVDLILGRSLPSPGKADVFMIFW